MTITPDTASAPAPGDPAGGLRACLLPGLLIGGVIFLVVWGLLAVVLALLPADAVTVAVERPFERAAWAQADVTARRAMTSSLLRDELKPGLSRRAVLELLGPPDERLRAPRMPNATFVWNLGESRSALGSRRARLVVEFDVADQVTRAFVD